MCVSTGDVRNFEKRSWCGRIRLSTTTIDHNIPSSTRRLGRGSALNACLFSPYSSRLSATRFDSRRDSSAARVSQCSLSCAKETARDWRQRIRCSGTDPQWLSLVRSRRWLNDSGAVDSATRTAAGVALCVISFFEGKDLRTGGWMRVTRRPAGKSEPRSDLACQRSLECDGSRPVWQIS